MSKLTVGQFRATSQLEKPALHIKSSRDKIKMEHYVSVHTLVVNALQPLLDGRGENAAMLAYNSFNQWIKRQKSIFHIFSHFVLGDLRKFAKRYRD